MKSSSDWRRTLAVLAGLCLTTIQATGAAPRPEPSWTQVNIIPEIQGNTPIAAWSRGGERCFDYPLYSVSEISQQGDGRPGSARWINVITVRAASATCKTIHNSKHHDNAWIIKNNFEFFKGLVNNVLITDTGSGPDGRTLTLYDIKTQSQINRFNDYSDPVELRGSQLSFWLQTGAATKHNCPSYQQWRSQGLGAEIETQMLVDLRTNRVTNTTNHRCKARQSQHP